MIVDISNPSSPILKGSYNITGYYNSVSVSGNYAYVTLDKNGLVIVDISNSSSPILKGRYDTAGQARAISVSGNYAYIADYGNGLVILKTNIQNQTPIEGSLIQVEGSLEVYLIENGMKRHFTSPEALEWNGYSFDDVTSVTIETLQNYPDGQDISISQAIIDKYHALGGAPIFGASSGEGEKTGESDRDGIYCSYVNFENGAIECFQEGDRKGEAYAIFNPLFSKWASMGYGKSVLGYPIDNMSEVQNSIFETPFRYQNFANGTEKGALEYNISSGNVFEVHGAIFAKWGETGFAEGVMGLVTGDEKVAAPSKFGTVGKYSEFENGHIHWISDKDGENECNSYRGKSFITYGDLDAVYTSSLGTGGDLGFPIMDQKEIDEAGHGYCKFEGGTIEWDDSTGPYKVKLDSENPIIEINSPNNETNWQAGTIQIIQWSYTGNPGSTVEIEMLKDGQVELREFRVPIGENGRGFYEWKIEQSQTYGSDYQVRITSTSDVYTDTSDYFTISRSSNPLSVKIISPNNEDQIIEDEDVTFSSEVSGGVPPYKYEWKTTDGDILSNSQNFDINFYDYYGDNIKKLHSSGLVFLDLIVKDANGTWASAGRHIYVVPPSPTIDWEIWQNNKAAQYIPDKKDPYEIRIKITNIDDNPHYYSLKLDTPPGNDIPTNWEWKWKANPKTNRN